MMITMTLMINNIQQHKDKNTMMIKNNIIMIIKNKEKEKEKEK